jgi:hypothetical protein
MISKYIHDYFQKLSANSIDIENIENTENTFSITSNNPQNVLTLKQQKGSFYIAVAVKLTVQY